MTLENIKQQQQDYFPFFNITVRYFKHSITHSRHVNHGQSEIPKKHTQTEQDASMQQRISSN